MARQARCAECRAPLPQREGEPHDAYRVCLACTELSDGQLATIERSDRRHTRAWTADEVEILILAAKAIIRVVPPDDRWRREWLALIDALDRTTGNGGYRNG